MVAIIFYNFNWKYSGTLRLQQDLEQLPTWKRLEKGLSPNALRLWSTLRDILISLKI
jgi:hypothetical protein